MVYSLEELLADRGKKVDEVANVGMMLDVADGEGEGEVMIAIVEDV